jgi:YgiT-type zinc finger domain-containing protein
MKKRRKSAKNYDYGECVVCTAQMEERHINQDFWVRGELIIVEDVPAGVCPQCGEKVVKADVGRWIASLIENSERIASAPRVSVPKIKYDPEEITA